MRTVLATVAAFAASIALAASAVAADPTPVPGTIGLRLQPAPIAVDEGERTITATNLSGGVALDVVLTTSEGYAVEPTTFTLAPDATQEVAIVTVDPSRDGTVTAVGTTDATGMVTSAISVGTRFVHVSWLEQNGESLILVLCAAGLGIILAIEAVRRKRTPKEAGA